MYSETPAQLVAHLTHPNGWWRDTAQRLLVLEQDKSVVPALADDGADVATTCWRAFHAMWTLEGLERARRRRSCATLMKDPNPRMRVQAIRASETLYKAGNRTFADDYRAMTKDADPNVVIQAMLTANLLKLPDAADVIKAARSVDHGQGRRARRRPAARRPPGRAFGAPPRHAHAGGREAARVGQRRVQLGLLDVPRDRTARASRSRAPRRAR